MLCCSLHQHHALGCHKRPETPWWPITHAWLLHALVLSQVEDALAAVRGVRRRQRLRNAAVLLFTDWREVWTQVRHKACF